MVKTITKNAFSIFVVFLAYFIPAKLGFFIALPPDNATAIWPASGIAAAAVIFFGYKTLPGIFLGSLAANLTNFTSSLDIFIDKALNVVPDNVGNLNVAHESEYSLEFWLAGTPEGRAILAVHNNPLARQINAQALNAVIADGAYSGISVAFLLACTPEGRAILAANGNALGLQITAQTLNAIIPNGPDAGLSVAFLLARTLRGRAILAANNNELGSQINAQTLNTVIPNGPYAGMTIAHILAIHDVGMLAENTNLQYSLLALRNIDARRLARNVAMRRMPRDLTRMLPGMLLGNSLGSKITAQTLNIVIPNGPNVGLSLELLLERHPVGREILAANNNRVGLRHRV